MLNSLQDFCFLNPSYVAIFYLFYSTILSVVFTYVQLPDSLFNQSDNCLNVFFMKYSYIYTTFLMLPFVCVLHYVLNYGDWKKSLYGFLRVFLFVFINFCIGEEFNILGFFFGACNMYSYYISDKVECISKGYQWTKLDISGHVFHILYSILVVLEELYFIRNWQSIKNKVDERILDDSEDDHSYTENPITEISRERFNIFKKLFIRNQCFLKTSITLLTVLLILLHLSIFFTLIYFHTAFEKIVATIIALIIWFVTYHVIYPISGFKTEPYSIETAEHDSLLENGEFSLIYGENADERFKNKNDIYKFFVRNPKSKPYEVL